MSYSANIFNETYEKTFNYSNTDILSLKIDTFDIFMENNLCVTKKINNAINCKNILFLNYATCKLFPEALSSFKEANPETNPFFLHQAILNNNLTFNQDCYISMYWDEYIFTGGAHGNTVRKSCTFSLETGEPVSAYRFFKNLKYKSYITESIISQATSIEDNNPGTFFENYRDLIRQNFDINNYYLTEDGIVFYFQQYEIASYSSGIQTFAIPYSEIKFPPRCKK